MGAFFKPFMGIIGSIVVVILVAAGPAVWWLDRRPADSPPLLHFKVLFWSLNWPGPSLKAQAERAAAELDRQRRMDKAAADAAKGVYVAFIREQGRRNHDLDVRLQAKLTRITTAHDSLAKEIPIYVTPQISARYPVPWGLVRLHDAAAIGAVSAAEVRLPAGAADDAASPFTNSDLASAFNDNYAECRTDQARLIEAQAYITDLIERWNAAVDKLAADQAKAISRASAGP